MSDQMSFELQDFLLHYGWIVLVVLALVLHRLVLRLFGMVIITQNSIGIVTKKYVVMGKNKTLPDGQIVALNGEAGVQADTLAPGVHFWLWPWQFEIIRQPFVNIEKGKLAIVEARDGKPITGGRNLGKQVPCDAYQNARLFLSSGGERGPQIAVIPPGTYRINTAVFSLEMIPVTDIPDNQVGVVTTKDGSPLKAGEIAGKAIDGHNSFQDAQAFIAGGGYKGLQEQVILSGRYFINPRFATIEVVPMTNVPIANVGVVISYVGEAGKDMSGDGFKHGNLVATGNRGVWMEPLDPGKYPINPYVQKVENVPTANVVLNWATGKTEAHNLDKNLSTITVRSSDGFKFNLDVSQIIHIPRNDAPKVIARFGTVSNLVTQVLEPTIGNYFRNAAQNSDVIDFLRKRQDRQNDAKESIKVALNEFNVGAVDTLIGDIVPPEELMKTLTDRKLAEQEQITYGTQKQAEEIRKDLQQARAQADTQPRVVEAERNVEIAKFVADGKVKSATGDAESKKIIASADANVKKTMAEGDAGARLTNATAEASSIKLVADAEAERTRKIGGAEADVIKQKIDSMDSDNYAAVQMIQALATSKTKLVPDIIAGGGSSDKGQYSGIIDVLMAQMLGKSVNTNGNKPATMDPAIKN